MSRILKPTNPDFIEEEVTSVDEPERVVPLRPYRKKRHGRGRIVTDERVIEDIKKRYNCE